MTPTVLSIGTTHPLNLAGIGLDLRVAATLGVRVLTIVAGVSAQSADRVLAREPMRADVIAAQAAAVAGEPIAAIRIGALVGAGSVRAIVDAVAALFPSVPIVCDPVIAASTGDRLADGDTVDALKTALFRRCTLVTPNLPEAELLLGRAIDAAHGMDRAAAELLAFGSTAVLLKGGHREGDALDVLARAGETDHFRAPRLAGTLRGTGDLLAFAIAARIAQGAVLERAVADAREFVRARIVAGSAV